jgi:hypothetical protein
MTRVRDGFFNAFCYRYLTQGNGFESATQSYSLAFRKTSSSFPSACLDLFAAMQLPPTYFIFDEDIAGKTRLYRPEIMSPLHPSRLPL